MAARAYWKGHLRMSLVSIPVEMFNAVETKNEITFRQIHKPSGRRVNYTKTVPGVGEIEEQRHRQRLRGRAGPVRHPAIRKRSTP